MWLQLASGTCGAEGLGWDNLRVGGRLAADASSRAEALQRVFELFPVLADRRRQRSGLLSGGEQQMLAMGRALMGGPRLLLLDEPSLGLAPKLVDRIGEIIADIHRQGTSVLLIEQNAAMGLRVADQAIVLEVGRVALRGPADEIAASGTVQERYLGIAPAALSRPAAARAARTAGPPAADCDTEADPSPPARTRDNGLAVRGVGLHFGGVTALADVGFSVPPGSVHALIGPNGAGKSSCLNVLTGVYRAAGGSVRWRDHELTTLRTYRIARLGVCRTFQNISLSLGATVQDNLLVGRHRLTSAAMVGAGLRLPRSRREEAASKAAVARVADLLGLGGRLGDPVGELPYGQRKRVELARALCGEPNLLLLDEPVAGMTHEESAEMGLAIRTARAELDLTILLVEHDMPFVMGLADRVTVLDFGRVIADDEPSVVQRDPAVLRAYLGAQAS